MAIKRSGNWIRTLLYKILPLETYLYVMSKFYFFTFNLGLLKNNRLYDYPYFLKNIVANGDVCIDIGANLGYITKELANLVGNNGKVYAVEPVKPMLHVLKKNCGNLSNVEILPFALGAENKLIKMGNNTPQSSGFLATGSNYVLSDQNHASVEFDTEMKKGSELFGHLQKLDFIKCDIEGYEIFVIPELEPVIQKHRPLILLEARHKNRVDLMKFFDEKKFKCLVLENGKLQLAKSDEYWDLLVVPEEKIHKVESFLA